VRLLRKSQSSGGSQLDFIQFRSIAERFSEAFQQYAWDFNHVGLLFNTSGRV
jgi:hypothetical protein